MKTTIKMVSIALVLAISFFLAYAFHQANKADSVHVEEFHQRALEHAARSAALQRAIDHYESKIWSKDLPAMLANRIDEWHSEPSVLKYRLVRGESMDDVKKSLFNAVKYLLRSKAQLKDWTPTENFAENLSMSNYLLAVNKLSGEEEAAVEVEFQDFVRRYQHEYEERLIRK